MDNQIKEHFRNNDPIIFSYIERLEPFERTISHDYFFDLCDSIVSQQLSIKAAATIFNRFKVLFRGKPTPQKLLEISNDDIRQAGISYSKISYLKDLAEKIVSKTIDLEKLDTMSDKEVMQLLTQVKGIGPWTVEMFLMFSLNRDDIFSHGDLGLKKAIQKLYGFKKMPSKQQVEKITKNWSPYKTYACRILWKTLDIK